MIEFRVYTSVHGEGFIDLYELYRSIFTDKNEAETFDGIADSLRLRNDSTLISKYGNFQEYWVAGVDIDNGKIVGGVNYTVFEIPFLHTVTVHINYLFTAKEERGKGIGSTLLTYVKAATHPNYIFCEQNDAQKMSVKEVQQHFESSGISAEDRNRWWEKRGFVRMDFNYTQPPLYEGGKPGTGMFLSVRPLTEDAAVIVAHLRRFFYISVLKGRTDFDPLTEQILKKIECTYLKKEIDKQL